MDSCITMHWKIQNSTQCGSAVNGNLMGVEEKMRNEDGTKFKYNNSHRMNKSISKRELLHVMLGYEMDVICSLKSDRGASDTFTDVQTNGDPPE